LAKHKVAIGFKSGTNFNLEVDSLKVRKNEITNLVDFIEWTGGPQLLYMNLDQVEYVIVSEK
jgi:hypothetical protein